MEHIPFPYKRFSNCTGNNSKSTRIILVFIIIAVFIVSCLGLLKSGYFIWDDKNFLFAELITRNSWKYILIHDHYGLYHPVTTSFIKLTYLLINNESIFLHMLNLLIHIINSLLLLKVLRHFKISFGISFLIFALFLFHPHNIETFVWLTSIKDLLSGFFVMATVLYYLKFREQLVKGNISKNLTLILLCILAMLSKPSTVYLPVIIYLLESLHSNRLIHFTKIYLFYASIPIIVIIIGVNYSIRLNSSTVFMLSDYGFYERNLIGTINLFEYALATLNLSKTSVFYPFPFRPGHIPMIYNLYIIYPVLLFSIYFLIKRKFRLYYASLVLIGFLILLPVLQLIPIGDSIRNDRYSYMFNAYFLILISIGLSHYAKKTGKSLKPLTYFFLVMMLVNTFFQFHKRINEWESSKSIIEADLKKYETSEVLINALGVIYLNEHKFSKSIQLFSRAIELDPGYIKAYTNSGKAYSKLNQTEEAVYMLQKSIDLYPFQYEPYFELAKVYYQTSEYNKADSVIQLRFDSGDDQSLNLLGKIKYQLGDVDESIKLNQAALSINRNEFYLYDLAISYGKSGNYNKSLHLINEALKMNNNFADAHFLKGLIFIRQGKNPCVSFKKALSLGYKEAQPMMDKYCP